jgi:CheY-like chemotaxis protein
MDAALRATLEHEVDAMVCDLELPDGDGCALLTRVRRREGWHDLPAVAISGYSDAHRRRQAIDCGFDHFTLKPFRLEELTSALCELIDRESELVGMSCHAVTGPAAHVRRRR